MKKRIISLMLLCIMLLSLTLTSCSGETEVVETAAKVYTLYTICGESTTAEALREVEIALNYLTYYQLGLCVKLVMVNEDEYGSVIDAKYKEIADFIEKKENDKKGKDKDKSSEADSSDVSEEAKDVFSGEDYIKLLEDGGEYEFEAPRLDIFLVLGFDSYTQYVSEDKLAALDEKLQSEAKIIKDFIYPTFLSAAKIIGGKGTRKTYGIPMNTGIGTYEYVVFDEELLTKYKIDATTMETLEDLEAYLRIIKENEPDVVPLANAFDSTRFSYLFNAGFPAYVDSEGVVQDPLTDIATLDYYTLISRYRSLGYLQDNTSGKRFAVKFIEGTFEDLEALEKETGRSYISAVHSYPVATNENTCKQLFCVSKYTTANELTDVSELLAFIETDSKAANLLTYGVENVHYTLDENGQVQRINNDYINEQKYTGNAFLTYTLQGENPKKWSILMEQNLDSGKSASQSVSLGFGYYPQTYTDPDNKTIVYEEPNYVTLLSKLSVPAYEQLITGKAGYIDEKELFAEADAFIRESIYNSIKAKYQAELTAVYYAEVEAVYDENSDYYKQVVGLAYNAAVDSFLTSSFRNKIKNALTEAVRAELGPDATSREVAAVVAERNTIDYQRSQVLATYTEAEISTVQAAKIVATMNAKIKEEKANAIASDRYKNELDSIIASSEVQAEINSKLEADNYELYQSKYASIILEKINEYCKGLHDKYSASIKSEYDKFVNSLITKFDFNDKTKRSKALYNTALDSLLTEDISERIRRALKQEVSAEMSGANPEDIDVEVTNRMTSDYLRTKVLDYVSEAQIKAAYNKVLETAVNKAVGLITVASEPAEGEESKGEGEGEETEEPVPPTEPDETKSYFQLVFEKRIQKQYYVYSPLPVA